MRIMQWRVHIMRKPEEKIEFSSLMYEIKVLPLNYSGAPYLDY